MPVGFAGVAAGVVALAYGLFGFGQEGGEHVVSDSGYGVEDGGVSDFGVVGPALSGLLEGLPELALGLFDLLAVLLEDRQQARDAVSCAFDAGVAAPHRLGLQAFGEFVGVDPADTALVAIGAGAGVYASLDLMCRSLEADGWI